MYIRDLPGQEGLASQSHLRAGTRTTCSARQGKGQPDRAYLAIRLLDGGRRLPSLRLLDRDHPAWPRTSAHLGADGHGPRWG